MKSIVKLDDKIIEKFETSEGLYLVKGGVTSMVEFSGNGICFNRNCKSCPTQPTQPTQPREKGSN